MNTPSSSTHQPDTGSRRKFLGSTAAAGALSALPLELSANQGGSDALKIGLIGCGGRGSGAAAQALNVEGCKLVAMGDAFQKQLNTSHDNLVKQHGAKVEVPDNRKFVGFDAYEKVMEHADLVILATPPGFRPIHFEAAIKAGKHVFMEKPVAVDAPGVRKVLEAAKLAEQNKQKVVVGLQRRYQKSYREAYAKAIEGGGLGKITGGQVYWNSRGVWVRDRMPDMNEMQYQMTNWYYFNWLCGDHINEQHIHNIDVANWFIGEYPTSAQGMGGREVRKGKEHGEIFDHHYVEFAYPGGAIINSQSRHQPNTLFQVREELIGTKGRLLLENRGKSPAILNDLEGKSLWRHRVRDDANPYQVEHNELQAAIRSDEIINNAEYGAKSTLTAIMGRMATYSGKKVTWEEALNSELSLMPEEFSFDANPPVMPGPDGYYPAAIPGETVAV